MTKTVLRLTFLIAVATLLLPRHAAGQFAPTAPSRSEPKQLPLSGNTTSSQVKTGQATAPTASTSSVNTLNSSIQIDGPYQGSTPVGIATKEALLLSLDEAIKRGLAYNLGTIGAREAEREARAQRLGKLAQLLPDINAIGTVGAQQLSLATFGFKGVPGLPFPKVIGPFNFFEAGAVMSQTVIDLTAL